MQKITPCLWFDNNAEEAIEFYSTVFNNVTITDILRNGPNGPGPEGSILTAKFTIEGYEFLALNGGPLFKFNEAISLIVDCPTQEEIDEKWAKLTADGGEDSMCGWLKDKYGLSWQLVPPQVIKMYQDADTAKADRAMQAMMTMHKLDIAAIERAYNGE